MGTSAGWVEIGDGFLVRRYRFYDQNIGLVLGRGEALVIDTRSTHVQGREILDHVREVTRDPVTVVVDTHGHFDHAFGNHVFRPATIWGQAGCVPFLERTGPARRARIADENPELAGDLDEVVIDAPDQTFDRHATIEVGGRPVEFHFLGRGHTDHDAVITVPGTDVVWAGDLVENGAIPYFGDAYPIDWEATSAALARMVEPDQGVIVPGHGDHAGRAFADAQAAGFAGIVERARRIHAGELDMEAALDDYPFPTHEHDQPLRPLERALAQLDGRLDAGTT